MTINEAMGTLTITFAELDKRDEKLRRETAEECARIAREFKAYMLVDIEAAIRAKFGLKEA